ncbi:MAG: hypothetical protein COC05_06455 [Gammaproteobacteria bacterium]|nr:MAG: hypothetical protein COC05_06455 [Gammaproteobacteria bacterium]
MGDSNITGTIDIPRFEFWVGELIDTCEQLKQENMRLRQKQSTLLDEKARLSERNSQVTQRLQTLIGRLKRMETV